jgi:hypothetical protein
MLIDILMWFGLVLIIVLGCFAKAAWLQIAACLILLINVVFFEMALEPTTRFVVSKKNPDRQWTPEFRDGAVEMLDTLSKHHRPSVLIGAAGLAILVYRGRSRKADSEV